MIETFSPSHYFDLKDFRYKDIFINCNYVWEVIAYIKHYLKQHLPGYIHAEIPDGAILINQELISIGKGTIVEAGAYIQGPCIIGENCQIRQGAYIRGNFICGDHCVIGHASEIKNSLFLNHAQAPHFAYVGDSVLGNHTNLGAGTKCANLRFDGRTIVILFNGRQYNTHLRKFGAIFGDYAQTGCNSVTNPGTILGKKALIHPCANASGVIEENKVFHHDGSIHKVGS